MLMIKTNIIYLIKRCNIYLHIIILYKNDVCVPVINVALLINLMAIHSRRKFFHTSRALVTRKI